MSNLNANILKKLDLRRRWRRKVRHRIKLLMKRYPTDMVAPQIYPLAEKAMLERQASWWRLALRHFEDDARWAELCNSPKRTTLFDDALLGLVTGANLA